MAAAQVVEGFDPFERGLPGVGMIWEVMAVGVLDLEGREERFGASVVVAVAPAAHRGGDVVSGEFGAEAFAGVLDPAVGVEHQAIRTSTATPSDGHGQSGDDEVGGQRGREGPTDHPLAVGIDDHRQIEPAGRGGQIGDIGLPDLVAGGDGLDLGKAVGSDRIVVITLSRLGTITTARSATQTFLAHQSSHSRFAHVDSRRSGGNRRRPAV